MRCAFVGKPASLGTICNSVELAAKHPIACRPGDGNGSLGTEICGMVGLLTAVSVRTLGS